MTETMTYERAGRGLRGVLAILLTVGLLAACVDLEPRQSNMSYYVLSDAVTPTDTAAAPDAILPDSLDLVVGIRKVRLATYLNTPSLTTRYGAHQVEFAEFHRWGEDLADAISRSVAQSLDRQNGILRVDQVPWPDRTEHDLLVQMHVLRFEGEAPSDARSEDRDRDAPAVGRARVVVAWELVDPETQTVWVSGRTDHSEPGWTVGDYPALTERLDAALNVVAADLVTQMKSLARNRASGELSAQ
jgi:uncharacterized lipoprotein YmbA